MTTLTAPEKPIAQCVLRFDDRDADTLVDDAEVPACDDRTPMLLDRCRYTVNVYPDQHKVTVTTNQRFLTRRASGKVFAFWSIYRSLSITRTKAGLILARLRSGGGAPRSWYIFTAQELSRLVGRLVEPTSTTKTNDRRRLRRNVAKAVASTCGDWPDPAQRFPLLAALAEEMGDKVTVTALISSAPAQIRTALCDATTWAEMVKNLFGVTRYRRSLTRAVTSLLEPQPQQQDSLQSFSDGCWLIDHLWAYRGLVPIDWIIDTLNCSGKAIRAIDPPRIYIASVGISVIAYFGRGEVRMIRTILRQLPQPVLRRLLRYTAGDLDSTLWLWSDICRVSSSREIIQLAAAVVARKQRNLRGFRELEQLILHLPKRSYATGISRAEAAGRVLENERYDEAKRAEYNHLHAGDQPVSREQWVAHKTDYLAVMKAHLDQERERRAEAIRQRDRKTHEWAQRTTSVFDTASLPGGHRIVVAREAQILSEWAVTLGNCIDSYANRVDTSVLGAIVDPHDTAVANFHLVFDADTDSGVLDQIFGRFNYPVAKTLDSEVIEGFLRLCDDQSITISTFGHRGLAAA